MTGQEHSKTTVVYEYPQEEGDPYYPVPCPENAELYAKYKELADSTVGVHFAGRLATYKYYNMDQVVAQALTLYQRLIGQKPALKKPRSVKSLHAQEAQLESEVIYLPNTATTSLGGDGMHYQSGR
jgi:hypothetical protein